MQPSKCDYAKNVDRCNKKFTFLLCTIAYMRKKYYLCRQLAFQRSGAERADRLNGVARGDEDVDIEKVSGGE